jgi:hypothetical protein
MRKIQLLLIIISVIVGCKNSQTYTNEIFTNYPGVNEKVLVLDQNLKVLNGKQGAFNIIENSGIRVFSFIDGSCSACINKIQKLDSLYSSKLSSTDIGHFIIVGGGDGKFLQNFVSGGNFKSVICSDLYCKVLFDNDLMRFGYLTYVVNRINHIILVGDPFIDPGIMKALKYEYRKVSNLLAK